MEYLRGGVWWYSYGYDHKNKYTKNNQHYEPGVEGGTRPVLIISNNSYNLNPKTLSVNCLAITGTLKPSPVHVNIDLFVPSQILCEQILTISKRCLSNFICTISPKLMEEVESKLMIQTGISPIQQISKYIIQAPYGQYIFCQD